MKTPQEISLCLVDDDKLFLRSLEHQLRGMFKPNVNIRSFGTAEECLANLKDNPTIVVLDYYLNGKFTDAMNGIEALKKIKEADPEALVIMVSGQNKMNLAVDMLKHGAYDYVIKNESVFAKVGNSIKHALANIMLSRQLRARKKKLVVSLSAVSVLALAAIILFLKYR